jgi:hypothetical protein
MKSELLPDFPPGPLDIYRNQASFDWKKLKLFLEDESITEFKVVSHLLPYTLSTAIVSIRHQYDQNIICHMPECVLENAHFISNT